MKIANISNSWLGFRSIEVMGKVSRTNGKSKIVRVGDYVNEEGFYNLTSFSKAVKLNMHNFNRSILVKNAKSNNTKVDGNLLIDKSAGNAGVTMVHPIIMLTVLKGLDIELFLNLELILLNGLDKTALNSLGTKDV